MMESNEKFGGPAPNEESATRDGEIIILEELGNGFLEMMAKQPKDQTTSELPKEKAEHNIRFLIKVFLIDKKIFDKDDLDSEKATNLINHIYEFFTRRKKSGETESNPLFAKKLTESMVRQARLHQLGEKKRARLTEEEEKGIFGQTVKEYDEMKNG
ncbi:MAG: hypothetical protein WC831_02280 [Parcubacteria group bacterium]|jgi:hypothetical protein